MYLRLNYRTEYVKEAKPVSVEHIKHRKYQLVWFPFFYSPKNAVTDCYVKYNIVLFKCIQAGRRRSPHFLILFWWNKQHGAGVSYLCSALTDQTTKIEAACRHDAEVYLTLCFANCFGGISKMEVILFEASFRVPLLKALSIIYSSSGHSASVRFLSFRNSGSWMTWAFSSWGFFFYTVLANRSASSVRELKWCKCFRRIMKIQVWRFTRVTECSTVPGL